MADAQSYKSHAQYVPLFHFVLLPFLLVNVLLAGYLFVRSPGLPTGWQVLLSIALFLIALFARVFALKAQDRVIRLEERLRLRERLGDDLQQRIDDFTCEQLIALRFASDGELPELSARVLRDGIAKRDAIKQLIRNWRADTLRV